MKLLAVVVVYLLISPAGCNDKNVQHFFPPNLTVTQRQSLEKKWEAGKVLFKNNCAKCHGVFTKGVTSIPNFTKVQIDHYAARFLAKDPKNHSVMLQLTQDDFSNILIFLNYLKRDKLNGAPSNVQNGTHK